MENTVDTLNQLFACLQQAPSPYHAVRRAAQMLKEAGFTGLHEGDAWQLEAGRGYFVTRNQSSIIAWRQPERPPEGWRFSASHVDSPCWRLKTTAAKRQGYSRAEVEGYGGMIMSTWLDRPLGLAGRVLCRTEQGVASRLVEAPRDWFVIPNQAIHMNRGANQGYAFNAQQDMQPIFGGAGLDIKPQLAQAAGCRAEDILDMDLNLVVRDAPRVVGLEGEYFLAPRIDDQECVFTTLLGFLGSRAPGGFWCAFDNEEVGSSTRQGAHGTFLPDVLGRVCEALGMTGEQRQRALSSSLLLSCDNAHALHPNHPETGDPERPVYMNGGVVIKYNAAEHYTSTGLTASLVKCLCERAGVPWQAFANRADQAGGRTLGNLLGEQLSIPMADIGLAQLAMHSAMETAGTKDPDYMVRLIRTFYDARLGQSRDGIWQLQ